eukprot:TRINITY_DN91061_c0_g1_i1.p1 TRINITY_DN91061_c0_g1~~TRINITY_DN91061_c0_g1_i1.p1  ORF type:complete len:827 (+),score=94.32 TRINITY_DN91061_c0_g1_i1:59-2539(+)
MIPCIKKLRHCVLVFSVSESLLVWAAGTVDSGGTFFLDDKDSKAGACEPIWTARSIMYNPGPVAPRYSSEAACSSDGASIDTLFTVVNRKTGRYTDPNSRAPPDGTELITLDKTIGSVLKSTLVNGKWVKQEETYFEETIYIGGIVAAADCSTIAFVATRSPDDCGHAYSDVKTALAPCENADHDLVANAKGAWDPNDEQLLKDLGWTNPLGYCFEESWLQDDVHGPNGAQRRWPVGVNVPVINQVWLYEWTGVDAKTDGMPSLKAAPSGKYIINKMGPLDNWGQMALAFGHNDGTHGTYGFSTTSSCCCGSHVADTFLVIERGASHTDWKIAANRSKEWATGTGHTVNNRMTYNPVSKRYLRWVTTDNFDTAVNGGCNNTEGQEYGPSWYGSLGPQLSCKGSNFGKPWSNNDKGCQGYSAGYSMVDGDQRPEKDRYVYGFNLARQYMTKGTLATLVPLSDGGFLGVLIGEPNNYPKGYIRINNLPWYPKDPPTSVGIMRFDSAGVVVKHDGSACTIDPGNYGGPDLYSSSGLGYGTSKGNACVKWIRCDPKHYLSYPILGDLGNNRFLLGWTQMIPTDMILADFTGAPPRGLKDSGWDADQEWPFAHYMRVPNAFYVAEINVEGELLTTPMQLDGIGWGEYNNMVTIGSGKVAWTYIPKPTSELEWPSSDLGGVSGSSTDAQKANSPDCVKYSGGHHEETGSYSALQTVIYTMEAGTPSAKASMCESPADDGQPVCERLVPPLRNSTYGCGGPGGWERANGVCAKEDIKKLQHDACDNGFRGPCSGLRGPVDGTTSSAQQIRILSVVFLFMSVAVVTTASTTARV